MLLLPPHLPAKSLTSPESKHAGLTEDKHANAEKLMLKLTDVKRMCGSQPDEWDMGDWRLEFVEVSQLWVEHTHALWLILFLLPGL